MNHSCPLCKSNSTSLHFEDKQRPYKRCDECALVFVPAEYHLSPKEEKAIYDQHQNSPEDKGYRLFLSKLISPLIKAIDESNLSHPVKGLDFGSGPGPTLSLMLEDLGFNMSIYDIFYMNDQAVLNDKYDFITSTEVWEHLSKPDEVIQQIFSLLKDRGVIGIMTKRIPTTPFENWHYTRDTTHVSFFADETLEFIARKFNCKLLLPAYDTALFIRN